MKKIVLCSIYCLLIINGYSQNNNSFWEDAKPANMRNQTDTRWITPQKYRTLQLDKIGFEEVLLSAPNPNSRNKEALTIAIPMPDGSSQRFAINTTPTLHPELAAKYPAIQTYSGKGLSDPTATIHLDMTPQGFHGMILSPNGTVFIDPYYSNRDDFYIAYYKKDFVPTDIPSLSCEVRTGNATDNLVQDESIKKEKTVQLGQARMATINMRTYRIAIGTNGPYTAFHGGTVQSGLAAVTTAINRVKGVYEDELAVSFQLVADNDKVIFTNANDPYSNNSNSLNENTGVLNNAIGNANYDIGHVFTTGSGGLAGLGVICSSQKAEGTTGLDQPTGDPFHIDFVAHEIGHQFGGNHTFNGDSGSCSGGNRNGSTAYEPGSGSTIQAYAGICGNDNLQNNSDPYFHLVSLNEMRAHVTQESGANCGTLGSQNNTTPVANANAENINEKSIPANTPFELTGSATDANGDNLTYNWEQWNLGAQSDIDSPASGAPLFRSFEPTTNPTRIFPKLENVLSNVLVSKGEIIPSGNRTLNFQFIARDDNTAGGFGADMIELTVVGGTGPFKINSPNTATTLSGTTTVTWDVAGTNNSPINCSQVDIFLSVDGGQTFPQQVANDINNNGSASITLPNINSTTARLKIKCADNVFLDINDANFTITPSGNDPCTITDLAAGTTSACNSTTNTYTQEITVTYSDAPTTGNLVVNNQSFAITSSPQTITLTNLNSDGNMVNVTANFSTNTVCSRTENNLFQAPSSCAPICGITNIAAGTQTACNASNNTYTQEVTVTYVNPPSTGNLVVNNQTFTISSSPQTVTLTNLTADGNMVNIIASFSANSACTLTNNNLFTASASCVVNECQDYAASDVPKNIPSEGNISSTINITQSGTVKSVSIKNLKGAHDSFDDLDISLTSPDGTTVLLISEAFLDSGSSFDFNIADGGSDPFFDIENGNTYAPSSSLSAFMDKSATGNWSLTIQDFFGFGSGSLTGWTLELCIETSNTTDPCSITTLPVNDNPIPTGTYVSGGTITSTGTVANNTTVAFKAPTSITLSAGFTAATGSSFTAQIENCVSSFGSESIATANKITPPAITKNIDKKALPLSQTNLEVYPNPFKNQTQINYHLSSPTHLSIQLMDINGRLIQQVLPISFQSSGSYQLGLQASDLNTGVYFLQLQTNDGVLTKKLIIQR
ncbi:MAG: reprolysin-like metallopeptidase [Saprospiraceae bacterium]